MSWFSPMPKETLGLLYDIGSSSVGGSLVIYKDENTPPHVLYTTRVDLPLAEHVRPEQLLSSAVLAVGNVSQILLKNVPAHLAATSRGHLKPERTFVTLAAPWHVTQTRTISYKKDGEFTVSPSLVEDLIKEEINSFKDDPALAIHIGDTETVLIDRTISGIHLNGYETKDPYGKVVEEVEITLAVSVAPEALFRQVTEEIKKVFRVEKIQYSAFAVSLMNVLSTLPNESKNALLLDIGGEVSELTLVERGMLVQQVTVPVGKSTLLRMISDELGTFPEEALTRIRLASEHKEDNRFVNAIRHAEEFWLNSFHEALGELNPTSVIPPFLYLTSDEDIEEWFAALLRREPAGLTLAGNPFSVTLINAARLGAKCTFLDPTKPSCDPFLVVGALYAKEFFVKEGKED